ncbi:hypothetical protein O0I10_007666 [Lichtheimia ornata]|uniref:Uncharacterized protein n=1 Tax=Lichtheimia ornata TaxID=688661 RepID=A0AAD7UZN9_9FUNG|nr:uncharacterized protein O0I10_007666 [Lichtheimia ornata]KAJ8656589.1 hypothetical protein O0I10_007666 [Lichtheimia ornata]
MRLKLFRTTNNDNVASLVEDDKYPTTTTSFYHEQNRALTEPRRHIKSPIASSTPFSSTGSGRKQQRRRRLSLVMHMFEENSNVKEADERSITPRAPTDDEYHNEMRQSAGLWSSKSYSNMRTTQSNIEKCDSWSSLLSETESQLSTSSSSSVYECAKEGSSLLNTASQCHITALSPPPRPNASSGKEKHTIPNPTQHDACEYLTTMPTSSNGSSNKSKMDILMEENRRLREANTRIQQMQHEDKLSNSKSMAAAYQEIKYLRRVISCTRIMTNTGSTTTQVRRRRHSTDCMDKAGEPKQGFAALAFADSARCSITSTQPSSVNLSYERKLKILLDEIEAMQTEDDHLQAQRLELERKNIQLKHSLENSQETIRQLQHELRLARA